MHKRGEFHKIKQSAEDKQITKSNVNRNYYIKERRTKGNTIMYMTWNQGPQVMYQDLRKACTYIAINLKLSAHAGAQHFTLSPPSRRPIWKSAWTGMENPAFKQRKKSQAERWRWSREVLCTSKVCPEQEVDLGSMISPFVPHCVGTIRHPLSVLQHHWLYNCPIPLQLPEYWASCICAPGQSVRWSGRSTVTSSVQNGMMAVIRYGLKIISVVPKNLFPSDSAKATIVIPSRLQYFTWFYMIWIIG